MHAESGYWRPKPDGTIEVVIAQSNGLVEVQVLFANLIWFCVMDTLFDQLASCVSVDRGERELSGKRIVT